MNPTDMIVRVARIRDRRFEKAKAYEDMAAAYEIRADEVAGAQRDFLTGLGVAAKRNAATMREDAAALSWVLACVDMPGTWPEQAHEEYEKKQEALASAGAP